MDEMEHTVDSELSSEATAQIAHWQRISPIAILYFASSSLQMFLGNFVYLLPVLVVMYQRIKENPAATVPLILSLPALLVLYAALTYYFYLFRVQDDTVEIKAGVFSKKHLNLPFSRIQNITLEQPFYYRMTGFVCLQLDTAGSAKQEAKIVALPLEMGHQLKQHILKFREETPVEPLGSENTDPIESTSQESKAQEQLLNRRSIKDLVIHGITNNRVWIILGAAAPFYDNVAESVSYYLASLGIDLEAIFSEQSLAWWELGLYALSLTMIIMLLLTLISIAGSILMFYGFTLSKTKDRYVRRSGLITRQEVSMKLSRLQLIARKQDWLDIVLGRINLQFEQNSSGVHNEAALGSQNKILVPSIKEQECAELISDAMPGNGMANVSYQPISRRFFWRYFFIYVFPIFAILAGLALYHQKPTELSIVSAVGALVIFLLFMRWWRWGYAFDQDFVYIRKGMLGVDYFCFPIFKVQQTKKSQSVFMKRQNLATCKIVLASGGLTIPFIPEPTCHQLIDLCLYQVESEPRSWM